MMARETARYKLSQGNVIGAPSGSTGAGLGTGITCIGVGDGTRVAVARGVLVGSGVGVKVGGRLAFGGTWISPVACAQRSKMSQTETVTR